MDPVYQEQILTMFRRIEPKWENAVEVRWNYNKDGKRTGPFAAVAYKTAGNMYEYLPHYPPEGTVDQAQRVWEDILIANPVFDMSFVDYLETFSKE